MLNAISLSSLALALDCAITGLVTVGCLKIELTLVGGPIAKNGFVDTTGIELNGFLVPENQLILLIEYEYFSGLRHRSQRQTHRGRFPRPYRIQRMSTDI